MAKGDTWVRDETQKELRKKANKVLTRLKKERLGKQYRLEQVCDKEGNPIKPLTYKEVEIKENNIGEALGD